MLQTNHLLYSQESALVCMVLVGRGRENDLFVIDAASIDCVYQIETVLDSSVTNSILYSKCKILNCPSSLSLVFQLRKLCHLTKIELALLKGFQMKDIAKF